jgi:hypothetical protein
MRRVSATHAAMPTTTVTGGHCLPSSTPLGAATACRQTVWPNSLEMPLAAADLAIVDALSHELLDPEILKAAAARAVARVATPPVDVSARRHALQTALTHTETKAVAGLLLDVLRESDEESL